MAADIERPKRSWISSIPEFGSGIAIVLGLIYSVVADLEAHFIVTVMVILAGFLFASILYRQNADDKLYLAKLRHNEETEKARLWSQQSTTISGQHANPVIERMAREKLYLSLIDIFEKSSKDTTLSEQQQAIYKEVVKRLRDMQDSQRLL